MSGRASGGGMGVTRPIQRDDSPGVRNGTRTTMRRRSPATSA